MKKQLLLFTSLLMTLWSCQQDQVAPKEEVQLRELSIEEKELLYASNKFAMDLTRELVQDEPQNLFFSPYYIHMDLSMAINGAESNTLTQMQKVHQCDVLERLEINKLYNSLNTLLESIDTHVQFVSAHSLWHREEINIRPLFSDIIMAYYGAGVEALDFDNHKASLTINKWVEEHTSGKVKAKIPALVPYESLYMISATHLKGYWTFPFAKENTAPGTFYLNDKEEVTVPMMFTDQATYRYHQDANKTLLDIPYGNKQYSMTIVMPHHGDSIAMQLENLRVEALEQALERADTLEHHLYLPKFNISSQLNLKRPLANLGIKDAFSAQADFSGILDESSDRIKVADMIHQASIEVNESGIQSVIPRVAATSIAAATPVIRIDRPFIFFVREQHTGLILYAGVIQNPAVAQE
ncbi:serine protease inhibitor [Catalinimonas alkaloidigena]|uniref:serpin family protein n=1 Tax=Catalinimonas alkaloidigena TaxID=1075417 RepID=UPI002406FBBC|nr:serpin family protein [Catalinimonas alkaloidigena]MDF9800451.1 serine protease inhibitor [Catalinimonas alkaloidigena]